MSLPTDSHHRGEQGRDEYFLLSVYRNDVACACSHGTARSDDATTCHHSLTASRRQEVRLVFDGQDRASGWHQSHRGVAASDVGDRGENGSGHEAMMLSKVASEGKHDLYFAGRHPLQSGPDRPHQRQTVEALVHGGLEVRVLRIECSHVTSATVSGPP